MIDYKIYRMARLGNGVCKAFVDICFDNTIVVKGFRIVQGKESLFVGKPQEKGKDSKWYDTFFFIMPEDMKKLEQYVISEYEKDKV